MTRIYCDATSCYFVRDYKAGRVVVVADREFGTSDIIAACVEHEDAFEF